MLTRFVASTGAPREPILDDAQHVEDVRCIVRLHTSRGQRELVIATELGGGIRVFGDREGLPQRTRTQIAFDEVASGKVLEIETDELHIFDLQTVEMLPDAPGVNDALYLYGAMRGPYPASLGTPVVAVDGQLTVTRADLLSAVIDGVTRAFAYAPDPHGSRCVHALLPAERADVIATTGRGIVLALPLVPGWLMDCPVPNDQIAAQILYDVLSALRTDLGVPPSPPLPVPSRAALEAKLVDAGWRIDGDTAVRAKGRGLLGSVLQGSERRTLPRQGTLDELVAEAKAMLSRMPNIPTAETVALQRRTARDVAAHVAPIVQMPAASPPPSPPSAMPRPRVETPRTDWMKDFVEAHRAPSRPAPRLSTPARVVAPKAAPNPSWMNDFEEPDEPDTPEPSPPKRDWSDDFD